ncbi:porin [Marinifilum fragile]|uniref:porin n=1 Tax=Marinifilum fragile TaxID=570161 RepID=UPI002AA8A0EC|nr:porin [Marinifilum fragile]
MKKLYTLLFAVAFCIPMLVNAQGCDEPSGEGVNVFGFIQPRYQYSEKAANNDTNTFDFNRARIGVMGKIPYDISYYVVLEASPDNQRHDGDAYLLDAFVTYSRYDFARLTMGSFKSPISLELNTACRKLHTINRSRVVEQLASPDRDRGIMVMGGADTTLFQYSFAITNGTGLFAKDDNKEKDYAARVVLNPHKNFKLGASYLYGESASATAGMPDDEKTRWGADLQYKNGGFMFQAEYLYGKDVGSYTTGGGCGEELEVHQGSIKRDGGFIMGMYKFKNNLQPVLKIEYYDSDKDMGNNTEFCTTYGVNYWLNDWTKIQANYVYRAERADEIDNDIFMLQVTVNF